MIQVFPSPWLHWTRISRPVSSRALHNLSSSSESWGRSWYRLGSALDDFCFTREAKLDSFMTGICCWLSSIVSSAFTSFSKRWRMSLRMWHRQCSCIGWGWSCRQYLRSSSRTCLIGGDSALRQSRAIWATIFTLCVISRLCWETDLATRFRRTPGAFLKALECNSPKLAMTSTLGCCCSWSWSLGLTALYMIFRVENLLHCMWIKFNQNSNLCSITLLSGRLSITTMNKEWARSSVVSSRSPCTKLSPLARS